MGETSGAGDARVRLKRRPSKVAMRRWRGRFENFWLARRDRAQTLRVIPLPMKLLPILLGVSLAANAALVVVHRSGDGRVKEVRYAGATNEVADREAPRFARPEVPVGGEGAVIAESIRGDDLARLRDELRAVGLDEDSVRMVVAARVWKRYETRLKALQPPTDPNRPWWRNDEEQRGQTREQRELARQLGDERKAELESLLGKDPREADGNSWLARQYGYLPPEKREELQRLEQDYGDLANEFRREARGFMLPADQEKLKFIEEEKRRDLASLLSPAEYADYEMRQSRTAQNLRWRMTQMDATEAEFRTIFELQKEFDERFTEQDQSGGRTRTQEEWKVRNDAEKAMRAQIRDALGAERYADYVRAQDNEYQQLRGATKRFQLPPDTPNRVYALRDEVPKRATRIADDKTLSPDQKREGLRRLAEETRDRVRATLGSEAAQAYFANNGMQWVKQLEGGTIVTFNEDGGQSHRRIEPAPKPAAAAKK